MVYKPLWSLTPVPITAPPVLVRMLITAPETVLPFVSMIDPVKTPGLRVRAKLTVVV
ncbi:hypothetical protein [Priestia aryabhattai]|uniref:hypothetical protein n=1 Tax=Priestia aryabhattai TaxID=412384 RepID=UPI00217514AD|nr:hypothetical protein [Priestia aryabhattai]